MLSKRSHAHAKLEDQANLPSGLLHLVCPYVLPNRSKLNLDRVAHTPDDEVQRPVVRTRTQLTDTIYPAHRLPERGDYKALRLRAARFVHWTKPPDQDPQIHGQHRAPARP
jgi:hypothetical protein